MATREAHERMERRRKEREEKAEQVRQTKTLGRCVYLDQLQGETIVGVEYGHPLRMYATVLITASGKRFVVYPTLDVVCCCQELDK